MGGDRGGDGDLIKFSFINSKQKNNILLYIYIIWSIFNPATRHPATDGINEKLMLFYIDMLIYHYKITNLK